MIQDVLRKISGVVLAAALVLTGAACTSTPAPMPTPSPAVTAIPEEPDAAPTVGEPNDAAFSLTMLDVGQGLSVLVQADGEYLLYDGGGRGASAYVVAYLQQHGVTKLEWLVASHYDEDHISGLVGALHTTPVEQALMPDYTTDTQIYQSLQNALEEKAVTVTYPAQGDTFSLGGAEIQIVGPKNYDYDSDNSNSLCLRIEYGDFCICDREEYGRVTRVSIREIRFPNTHIRLAFRGFAWLFIGGRAPRRPDILSPFGSRYRMIREGLLGGKFAIGHCFKIRITTSVLSIAGSI